MLYCTMRMGWRINLLLSPLSGSNEGFDQDRGGFEEAFLDKEPLIKADGSVACQLSHMADIANGEDDETTTL